MREFTVWAPRARSVDLLLPDARHPMVPGEEGHWHVAAEAGPESTYAFSLDGGDPRPDPRGRRLPDGPHGWSQLFDPGAYAWTDDRWRGPDLEGSVIYELHVGTFTPEGTLDAAAERLDHLVDLGVGLVELMPLAPFPGTHGWGYDGVAPYAVHEVYGGPAALQRFVDAAHARGVGVCLDVVYNHLGPDGNYLSSYSGDYFTDRYDNEWGDAIDFDGPSSPPVRELFIENAVYWIREFHVDGLRLDATQQIFDRSPRHLLAELSARTRAAAAQRKIVLVAENEPQDVIALRPVERGGWGLDALWSDDFHHAARVALTGRREAYYTDYRGTAQELLSCVKRGLLYQGQHYVWQNKTRGTPVTTEPAAAFVFYLQNHDQVANQL
ncbi:MAG TPA: alpha-amylase family glycosyl hydrolase, partial [Nocardioidaceae bacterium]